MRIKIQNSYLQVIYFYSQTSRSDNVCLCEYVCVCSNYLPLATFFKIPVAFYWLILKLRAFLEDEVSIKGFTTSDWLVTMSVENS